MATRWTLVLLACLSLAGAVGLSTAPAQEAEAPTIEGLTKEDAAKRLEEESRKLEETKKRAGDLEENVTQLEKEREELGGRLIASAKRVQESEAELTAIESKVAELSAQQDEARGALEAQHAVIGQLLAALQRMSRNPPPVMITRRDDALTMVRSAMMLSSVFPELRGKATGLADKLGELDRLAREATAESERLRAEQAHLAEEQKQLDALLVVKREEMAKSEAALSEVRQLAATQAETVADLNELIRKLDKKVAATSGLGDYERSLAEGVAPGQPGAPEPVAPPAAESGGEQVVILNAARMQPAMPFETAKKRLPKPVAGRKLLKFGQLTENGTRSKGAAFATRAGAQITSPCDGWIVYAGEFRSFGQILIINAGGGYHVLLAGMQQLAVNVGQFVLSGEPVGKMGEARAVQGSRKESAPILYVEFRNKERPVDPDPWWTDP